MKKKCNISASSGFTFFVLSFVTILLFSACSKNNDVTPQIPAAGLMAFNLAPDKPSIGFTVSGSQITNVGLNYTGYTGQYVAVSPGTRELVSFDFAGGSTIKTSNHVFEDSSYYSVFLLGANGQYNHVFAKDNFDAIAPVSGKAWVRYINAIADTSVRPNVTIGSVTEGAVFGTITPFVQVNAGSLTAAISIENVTRTITVEENKIYTILFVGLTNQTNPALAPQVKFIVNGSASN